VLKAVGGASVVAQPANPKMRAAVARSGAIRALKVAYIMFFLLRCPPDYGGGNSMDTPGDQLAE
jgi:hypothetical protein